MHRRVVGVDSAANAARSVTVVGRLLGCLLALVVAIALAHPASASPGNLDRTFSGDGKVLVQTEACEEDSASIALGPGGTIVLASSGDTAQDFYTSASFARLNRDGTLDTTFDGDGTLTVRIGTWLHIGSVAVLADGRVLAAGWINDDFALLMITSEGILDTSFGGGTGIVVTDVGTGAVINDMVVQDDPAVAGDERILVAGAYTVPGTGVILAVARYTMDGALDNSFSDDGFAQADFAGGGAASSLVLAPGGKIVVAGVSHDDFAVARFLSDGTLDERFSGDGKVKTDLGGTDDVAADVLVRPNGKIVAVGHRDRVDFAVVRYRADGTLDRRFAHRGVFTLDFAGEEDQATSILAQDKGKVIVVGYMSKPFGKLRFALIRLTTRGHLDQTFGGDGKVTTAFVKGDRGIDIADAIVGLPSGRLVVAGTSYCEFAAARYLGG